MGSRTDMVKARSLVSKNKFEQARQWYHEAGIFGDRAHFLLFATALSQFTDIHGIIQALQHCYEFCVKTLFLLTGYLPPGNHKPAKTLDKVQQRFIRIFPDFSEKEEFEKVFAWIKRNDDYMCEIHETAVYGKGKVPASMLFTDMDVGELFKKVAFLYSFLGGPLLWIGHELGYLTKEEQERLRDLFVKKVAMNESPELEASVKKMVNDFLDDVNTGKETD